MPSDIIGAFMALFEHDLEPGHHDAGSHPAHPAVPAPAPPGWTWILDCEFDPVAMVPAASAHLWVALLNAEPVWGDPADQPLGPPSVDFFGRRVGDPLFGALPGWPINKPTIATSRPVRFVLDHQSRRWHTAVDSRGLSAWCGGGAISGAPEVIRTTEPDPPLAERCAACIDAEERATGMIVMNGTTEGA